MLETTFNFAIAIGGAVLLFQFVMMLLGLHHHGADLGGIHHADLPGGVHDGDFSGGHDSSWGHDTGADGTHHGASWFYEIISIRTLSAAATFYGIAGKTAVAWGYSRTGAFVLAACAAAAAMYAVYWLFKQVYKLQHTGTENIRNAVGVSAVVYVPVPAQGAGAGKVTFKLQNRSVEYLAVTDDADRLRTGEKVVVVGIVSADTVRVARTDAAIPTLVSGASMS